MKKVIINDNERGLLFKHGKFIGVLEAGKHTVCFGKTVEVCNTEIPVQSKSCSLGGLMENQDFKSRTTLYRIGDGELGLMYVNGRFAGVLPRGEYVYFNTADERRVDIHDITSPHIGEDVPHSILAKLPSCYAVRIDVSPFQKGVIFFNGRFEALVEAGSYYFWKNDVKVFVEYIDTRLRVLNVIGQEMLSKDKVTLRINLACSFRVTDCVKIVTELEDYQTQLYTLAQLALREYVGAHRLDELLENKNAISAFVSEKLKEKENELFVSFGDASVKDIILPGEIRDIMNTVLVAEKKAQANVITRREEVASTRSLLNTARLMEENQTLYKLKELEYVERICENVGNININGNGDVISQLTGILRGGN